MACNMIGETATEESLEETEKIRLVSETKREFEENYIEVRTQIVSRFEEITKHLDRRKHRLLRQAEAIHRQQESLIHQNKVFTFKNIPRYSLNLDKFNEVKKLISDVGKLELNGDLGCITDLEPCKMSEYSDRDFECFDKKIERDSEAKTEKIERTWKPKGCFTKIEDEKGWRAASLDLEASVNFKQEQMSGSKSENDVQNIQGDFSSKPKLRNQFWDIDTGSQDADSDCNEKAETDELRSKFENDSEATDSASLSKSESDESGHNCGAVDDENSQQTNAQCERTSINENIIEKLTSTPQKRSGSPRSSRNEVLNHPEQVKQWLEQILLETEIEPNINEDGKIALKKLNMVN